MKNNLLKKEAPIQNQWKKQVLKKFKVKTYTISIWCNLSRNTLVSLCIQYSHKFWYTLCISGNFLPPRLAILYTCCVSLQLPSTKLQVPLSIARCTQCCQTYGFIRTNTDFWHHTELTYGISKNTDFFSFLYGLFIFSSIFTIFLGNFLWFLRTSQFYSGVKGVWCKSVTSMITKCWSDHRSDHNLLEWECRFTLGLNAATNTAYIKNCF